MLCALPVSSLKRANAVSRARICLLYRIRHGSWPNLDHPQSFNEHVQYRKLHNRDARMALLADKILVKQWVADRIGANWVIPTLWQGTALPPSPEWPAPFVLKSRHGCNQWAAVHDVPTDWSALRRRSSRWMRSRYGYWLDEWAYGCIPKGLLVEPYIGEGLILPVDYKFFVFGGKARFVQVHLGRASQHRWIVFDMDWRRVSAHTDDPDPVKPISFEAMVAAAEILGRDFDFVRVDLYEVDGRPLFGEMSFYPGSGLDPFSPVSLDEIMGACWRQANISASEAQQSLTSFPACS